MNKLISAIVMIFLPVMIGIGSVFAAGPSGPVSGTIEVSGTENWTSDVRFTGNGRLVVTGDLTLESSTIALSGTITGETPVITVKEGGTLTLSRNSRYDLSGFTTIPALLVERNGKFIVDSSEISGLDLDTEKDWGLSFFLIEGGEFHLINGSRIRNNNNGYSRTKGFAAVNNGKVVISNAEVSDNTFGTSMVFLQDSEIAVSDSLFTGNKGGNGQFQGVYSDIIIENSEFLNNTTYNFGGIICWTTGSIELTNDRFINTTAGGHGGVIYAEAEDAWEPDQVFLNIRNCEFTGNSAVAYGGAICIGHYTRMELRSEHSINVFIENTVFQDNHGGYTVGGAIYNHSEGSITMKRVVLTDGDSIGIRNGTGTTIIKPRNGAVIFGNKSSLSFSGFADLSANHGNGKVDIDRVDPSSVELSEKMFNGGRFHWHKSDGDPQYTLTNDYFYAVPSLREITEENIVLINGNTSDNGVLTQIMNSGTIIIGEDAVSFEITKYWENEPGDWEYRPDTETFLSGLRILADGEDYDLGTIVFVETVPGENGDETAYYYAAADPNVTFAVSRNGEDSLRILVEGLPVTIDGKTIEYGIRENQEHYQTEISGNMTDDFRIVNTWKPTQTPQPTDTPEPTALPVTPTSEPSAPDLFRLPEQLETLPQTGFPTK